MTSTTTMNVADAMSYLIMASVTHNDRFAEIAERTGHRLPTGELGDMHYPSDRTATATLELTNGDGQRKRYIVQVTELH